MDRFCLLLEAMMIRTAGTGARCIQGIPRAFVWSTKKMAAIALGGIDARSMPKSVFYVGKAMTRCAPITRQGCASRHQRMGGVGARGWVGAEALGYLLDLRLLVRVHR